MIRAFDAFDARADRILEPLRHHRTSIVVFSAAGHAGDFSLIWHVIGVVRSIGSMHRLSQALTLSIILGIESLIVNQGIKRLFKRERPTTSGDHRYSVRTPSTSSFPSGHASSAVCAALVLTSFTSGAIIALWWAIAAIVALSRVMVRIHHLSDVLGGLIVGAGLGIVAVLVVG